MWHSSLHVAHSPDASCYKRYKNRKYHSSSTTKKIDREPTHRNFFVNSSRSNTTYVAQMVVFATVIADACMLSDVIDCDVYETPLTFDDGKGATARREGGGGDHRGRAHAPAYERPRGSM